MPSFEVTTNVKVDDHKKFIVDLTNLACELLDKPKSYLTVILHDEAKMAWEGTFDPAYVLRITSLGQVTPHKNVSTSKALSEFFAERLKAPNTRGYIIFNDPGRDFIGYKGTTFGSM